MHKEVIAYFAFQILMKGVSYAQMEADEIKKVRSLQVEHITAAENDLLKLIYKIQSM